MSNKVKYQREEHGESLHRTREYNVWAAMIQRCRNQNNPEFKRYGARGIAVCDRWKHSYLSFLEDMGRAPDDPNGRGGKMTIERKNNNEGYCKENCKWATMKEQSRNRRRDPLSKLTEEDVSLILELVRCGHSQTSVAKKYGVHQCHVSRIVHGKRRSDK